MSTNLNFDDWDSPAAPAATLPQSRAPLGSAGIGNEEVRAARVSEHASPASPSSTAPGSTAFATTLSAATAGASLAPINAQDKRIVNGKADINQLAPFKYPWAWEFFLNANKNHWTPLEVSMAQDVHDYQHKLTPAERQELGISDGLLRLSVGIEDPEDLIADIAQALSQR